MIKIIFLPIIICYNIFNFIFIFFEIFNILFACIVCFVVSYACLPWGWAALLNGETSGTGMDSYGPALVKPMVGIAALIMGFQFIVNMINFLKEDNKI